MEADPLAADRFVYLFRLGEFHKIGCANRPVRRFAAFKTLPYESEMVHHFPTSNPFGVERALHHHFRRKRTKGEWFRLTADDVAELRAVGRADDVSDLPENLRKGFDGAGRGRPLNVWIATELRDALDALISENGQTLTAAVTIAMERHLAANGRWDEEKKEPNQ